jgi:hypothetical protein
MSTSDDVWNALNAVIDQQTFLFFVQKLIGDREDEVRNEKTQPSSPYGPGANGWENYTIEQFLEAAVAWAEDSDFGLSQGRPVDNLWRKFAEFLYSGKVYE